MKIIAKTDSGYLISATKESIANLMGYYSSYSDGFNRDLKIGDTIKISQMFTHLYTMKSLEKELAKVAVQLHAAADFVEKALPAVHRANKEEQAEFNEESE